MRFLLLLSCAAYCMASSLQLLDIPTANSQCDMCRRVVKDSKDRNQNREQTVFSLINGCKKLQNDLNSTCAAQVQAHAAGFGMETACTDLQLCPGSPKDLFCTLCKTTVKTILGFLNSSATQQQVLDAIKKYVCGYLPFGGAACKSAVDTFGPLIYKAFLDHDPEKVCQFIRLCSKAHLDEIACNECTTAFEKFQTKFEDNLKLQLAATDTQVCTNLPETKGNDCVFLASLFKEHVLSKVGGPAKDKCAIMGLCR